MEKFQIGIFQDRHFIGYPGEVFCF